MPDARKKPCRICRRWFRPDSRVGDRQRACGKPECQKARRQKTQASWRARNPGYATAHRITQRNPGADPLPNRSAHPPPLNQLPWDLAKDQFGGQGADFIGVMGTLLLRTAKDQFNAYLIDPTGLAGTLPVRRKRPDPRSAHTETRAATRCRNWSFINWTAAWKTSGCAIRHRQRRLIASLAETRSANAHHRHPKQRRTLSGHRRPQAHRRAPAAGPRHRRSRGVGHERSRSAGAGAFAADERAGSALEQGWLLAEMEEPAWLLDRRTGARFDRSAPGWPAAWRWWRHCRSRSSS